MIIKAKYPALYRPYMQDVYQGYGGLGTSHNNSVVTQLDSRQSDGQIDSTSTSYMFGGGKLFVYSNINTGSQLIFCLLYTSPSPRDRQKSRMPASA